MERKSKLTITIATAVVTVLSAAAIYAQDKYSLKSPSGIAFSDFKGYEDWSVLTRSCPRGQERVKGNLEAAWDRILCAARGIVDPEISAFHALDALNS